MICVGRRNGNVELHVSGDGEEVIAEYLLIVVAMTDKLPKDVLLEITKSAIEKRKIIKTHRLNEDLSKYNIDELLRRVMENAQEN